MNTKKEPRVIDGVTTTSQASTLLRCRNESRTSYCLLHTSPFWCPYLACCYAPLPKKNPRENIFMNSKHSGDLSRIKLQTIALMNYLRMDAGASSPYQLSCIIGQETKSLGWPDIVESNRLYKYFRGDVRRHPTQILNLLSQLFQNAEYIYWCGPEDLWSALWGEPHQTSTIIKAISKTLEHSTTEEALNNVFMDYLVHGSFSLTSTIAAYRYLATTDPYGRLGDGYGFGRAFSIYRQLTKILELDEIKKHLSELGIYEGVQLEINKIEKERVSNRPYWVSPIECGLV